MTWQVSNPSTSKFVLVGPGCTVPVDLEGGVAGYEVRVYSTIEGQAEQHVGTIYCDGSGGGHYDAESLLQTSFSATTAWGAYVGEKVTLRFELWQPIPPLPMANATLVLMTVPGMVQDRWKGLPDTTVANQEMPSSTVVGVRSADAIVTSGIGVSLGAATTSIENATTSGPMGTGVGACCPCATIGQSSVTTGGTTASGDTGSGTGLVVTQSRGLPLIYATRHTGKEMYKGPWGWYRTLGVYRRLFDQGAMFFEHVSILREDGTRTGYLKSGSEYQSASGRYDSLRKTDSGWFEKTKEGIYYEYNAHGNLKRVIDPNRNQHYYLYDDNTSSQRLTEIKATKGLRPYFYYDDPAGDTSLNTRIALRDPLSEANARFIYFVYDVNGYMTTAVGPEGCHWYFEYDKVGSGYNYKGKITKITDPDGYATHFGFDTGG